MIAETSDPVLPPDRPGCVTAYAVLLWLGAALIALGTLSIVADPFMGPAVAFCPGLLVVLQIVTGIGLWRMEKWGWWLVVISQALGVAFAILNLAAILFVPGAADTGSTLVPVITGLVSGGILYWFITNQYLFKKVPVSRTVIMPDGTAVSEPVVSHRNNSNMTVVIIIGVVLLFFILPVVAIAILTLLGPQIGNAFSGISSGLAAP